MFRKLLSGERRPRVPGREIPSSQVAGSQREGSRGMKYLAAVARDSEAL